MFKFLIGHRGVRKLITENTLESILKSFDLGATHAEIDVRETADHHLVLFHDPVTFRFNHKFWWIKKTKLKDLQTIKMPLGGHLTTFEEVLSTLQDKKGGLVIEIKVKGTEEKILDLVKKYHFENRVIFWSFYHDSLKKIDALSGKSVKKAILHTIRPLSQKKILERVAATGADFVFPVIRNVNNDYFNSHKVGVIKAKQELKEAMQFVKQGGTGIITVNPEVLTRLRHELKTG